YAQSQRDAHGHRRGLYAEIEVQGVLDADPRRSRPAPELTSGRRNELEHFSPISLPCLAQERRDGGVKLGVLVSRKLGDLAAGRQYRGARLAVFFDSEVALKRDGA